MMTREEFDRIDRLLGMVIERNDCFSEFQVGFALTNADRLDRYGVNAFFSPRQLAVIAEIEKRADELAEADIP